jgi:tRNA modification GTPase
MLNRLESSDIKICLLSLEGDGANTATTLDPLVRSVIDEDTYLVLNKDDVYNKDDIDQLVTKIQNETGVKKVWSMSCSTGRGVDVFLKQMIAILKSK